MNNNLSNIKKGKYFLDKHNCIGMPTETVYGLAANAYSSKAISKIFKLKKRPKNNPLIVHYSSLEMLKRDCILNKNFTNLYNKFCPGPLTFILKLKKDSKISKFVTNKKKTLAVRFPSHPKAKGLLKILNYPLAAPSANISSRVSPVTKNHVKEEFGKKIKYIIEGGLSKIGLESTIINLTGKPEILRIGSIDINKLSKVLNKKLLYRKKSYMKAPGQNRLHYSPGIPLRMNCKEASQDEAFILVKKRNNSNKNFFYLSKNKNLKEAARNLYSVLRMIKKKGYKKIAVEKIENKGIGLAINDRLLKASSKKYMNTLVSVNILSKNFSSFEAVKEISFSINESEILGLLGPNGCGKTTTIGMMLGLLKPTSGEVIINGLNVEKNRINLLKKMNFISPYIELPKKLTVKENLMVYGKLYSVNNINNRIDYLTETLRLSEFINKKTGELSSGQKNRVSLAKAVVNDPDILLLDEPTASLDPETGDFVRTFIEKISSEKKMSILLASHNMNEVKRLCKSILMMKDGKIIDRGTPSEIINKHGKKNLEEVFLKLNRTKNEL